MQTIVFDIDGVILNFAKAFATWWNETIAIDGEQKIPSNPHGWQFDHPNKDKILKAINEFISLRINYKLMEPGIPDKLFKLQHKYKIILLTSFPEEEKEFRLHNLSKHKIPYDQIIFATPKNKLDVIRTINPVAIVEDYPKNILEFASQGYKVLVPGRWNYVKNIRESDKIKKYKNWDELMKLI